MDLVVVGNVSLDTIEIGRERETMLGGAALHFSIASSMVGCATGIVGVVGPDFPLNLLPTGGYLDTTRLQVRPGHSTRFLLRYDAAKQLKEIVSDFGDHDYSPESLFPEKIIVKAAHITCKAPFKSETFLEHVVAEVVSTDVSLSSLAKQVGSFEGILDHANYLFLNANEYEAAVRLVDFRKIPNLVIILTRGEDGIHVVKNGQTIFEAPAHPSAALDPTGAGDVFAGACMGMLCRGASLKSAISVGGALASMCVEGWGSLHLLGRTQEELKSRASWIESGIKIYGD